MPVLALPDLIPVLQARRRLVGIDVGSKTLGIAISDGMGISATPLETIKRTKFMKDAAALVAILNKQQAGGIVVGLPINMDGTEGPRCQSVRQFATNVADVLKTSTDLPIAFWDERLSTAAVTRLMIEADLTRARRAELVDKMAAAYILQGALDFLRRQTAVS